MQPSKNLIDFITKEEGCVLHAYLDQAGKWTIGIGSIMYPSGGNVKQGDVITQQRADDMLQWELQNKAHAVNGCLINTVVNQNQFDALCDFTYNEGVGALQTSMLIRKVRNNPNNKDMIALSDVQHSQVKEFMQKKGLSEINTIHYEFMKWVFIHVDGVATINEDLMGRRNREWILYSTPVS